MARPALDLSTTEAQYALTPIETITSHARPTICGRTGTGVVSSSAHCSCISCFVDRIYVFAFRRITKNIGVGNVATRLFFVDARRRRNCFLSKLRVREDGADEWIRKG